MHDAIDMVPGEIFDPFSSKRVLAFDRLLDRKDDTWSEVRFDTNTEYLQLSKVVKPDLVNLRTELLQLQISREDLEDLDDDITEEPVTSSSSRDASSQASTDAEADIWAIDVLVSQTAPEALLTWDNFTRPEVVIPDQRFITETTAKELDRIQAELYQSEQSQSIRFAKDDAFQQALANLVFGRSSAFFAWSDETSKFDLTIQDLTISGCSRAASAKICEYFTNFGSRCRRLKDYSRKTAGSSPTEYAFQRSLERVLHSLESYARISRGEQARCIWMLKEVEKMTDLLSSLEHLQIIPKSSRSELHFLTLFIGEIDKIWLARSNLRPVLAAVLSDSTRPAVQQTRDLIGLQSEMQMANDNEVWLFKDLLPDLEKSVIDVKSSLAILNDSNSNLSQSERSRQAPVNLARSWIDVIHLQSRANDLENDSCASQAGVKFLNGTQIPSKISGELACSDPFSLDFDFAAPNNLSTAIDIEEGQESDLSLSREIAHLLLGKITGVSELSPIQAVELSLRPFIETQNRLTSFTMLETLFLRHELKVHLDTLHAFFFFGNRAFATRLVTALFDSSQDSIEGRRKTGLTGGLRLEDREVWPPASSELRLALNGILNETIQSTTSSRILDCVSFSIKDLSDDEAELCRDTHSIHALDFLRITYVAPDVMLESIITPKILEKYDRIFNFMLILLRVHSLCRGLMMRIVKSGSKPCGAIYNKFCIEANHFVTVFLDYAMQNATYLPWRAFEERVRNIHQFVQTNDYQKTMDTARSVSQLCQDHDDALDDMLKGLMLKKKHGKAFGLLCDILNLLLKFSSNLKNASTSVRTKSVYNAFLQLRLEWYHTVQEICNSTGDPALQRLQVLLLQMDLSGALGLYNQAHAPRLRFAGQG